MVLGKVFSSLETEDTLQILTVHSEKVFSSYFFFSLLLEEEDNKQMISRELYLNPKNILLSQFKVSVALKFSI